nr:FAR1 DNA binding domain, zinc finger, SWIM-type, MULE transposase domain, FHY3/FAR1 family [Tanacetum cinerariifolium]
GFKAVLAVLNTKASQSRQHSMSESGFHVSTSATQLVEPLFSSFEFHFKLTEFHTDLQLEEEAADLYTLSILNDVQEEILASITHCLSVNAEEIQLYEKYCIRDTELDACVHGIRCIVEDTVDRLVPFRDKLDLCRLELTDIGQGMRQSNSKGIVYHSRWKNAGELIQIEAAASKKRRTCFICRKAEGHNSRTCPYNDSINAANERPTRNTRS